jgi:predicted methyltransferase
MRICSPSTAGVAPRGAASVSAATPASDTTVSSSSARQRKTSLTDYAALMAAPDRSDADRQADKRRNPVPFLAFAGPLPGMAWSTVRQLAPPTAP